MSNQNKIDLKFLKEIKEKVDRMKGNFDLSDMEYVQTMVDDWIHELKSKEEKSIEDLLKDLKKECSDNGKYLIKKIQAKLKKQENTSIKHDAYLARTLDGEDPDNVYNELYNNNKKTSHL